MGLVLRASCYLLPVSFDFPAGRLTLCETGVTVAGMKTVSIRDLRQKWPAVERGLKVSGGILITRGSKPVARLLPLEDAGESKPNRFDPEAHRQWMQRTWGDSVSEPWVDEALDRDRDDG